MCVICIQKPETLQSFRGGHELLRRGGPYIWFGCDMAQKLQGGGFSPSKYPDLLFVIRTLAWGLGFRVLG